MLNRKYKQINPNPRFTLRLLDKIISNLSRTLDRYMSPIVSRESTLEGPTTECLRGVFEAPEIRGGPKARPEKVFVNFNGFKHCFRILLTRA